MFEAYHNLIKKQFGQLSDKMFPLGNHICWTVVIVFILIHNFIMCESCIVFQTKKNVAIDTNTCFFQNFTELFSEVTCMKSCLNMSTVSNVQTSFLSKNILMKPKIMWNDGVH